MNLTAVSVISILMKINNKRCNFFQFAVLPAITCFIFLGSCTEKTGEGVSQEITKAFSDAGLPVFNQKAAPSDFSLPAASSAVPEYLQKTINLGSLKGKVVLLNFWATWCGPCRIEMPSMELLYQKYRDMGFEILAVSSGERSSDVTAFMQANGFSFPAVLDLNGAVSRSYGIQAIPTSYIIDRDGMIILRLVGSFEWDTPQIHAAMELLLK